MAIFLDLTKQVLLKAKKPMTPKEIWEYAESSEDIDTSFTSGKTPWASIGARIYTDIRDGNSSDFIQVSNSPSRFFLSELKEYLPKIEIIENESETNNNSNFQERDLHQLLVNFANGDQHFKAKLKTIYHEASSKKAKGRNEWIHPDLVGVHLPFIEYEETVLNFQNSLFNSSIKLFSFEMKKHIGFSNLRESYFQAVSNSSWAHEGYLVAISFDEDPELIDEIRRLNNAFGIGIIKLDIINIEQSEILFPAKENQLLDWDTINKIATINPNFKTFLSNIVDDLKLSKHTSTYDTILDEKELTEYIKNKNIQI